MEHVINFSCSCASCENGCKVKFTLENLHNPFLDIVCVLLPIDYFMSSLGKALLASASSINYSNY